MCFASLFEKDVLKLGTWRLALPEGCLPLEGSHLSAVHWLLGVQDLSLPSTPPPRAAGRIPNTGHGSGRQLPGEPRLPSPPRDTHSCHQADTKLCPCIGGGHRVSWGDWWGPASLPRPGIRVQRPCSALDSNSSVLSWQRSVWWTEPPQRPGVSTLCDHQVTTRS